MSGIYEGMYKTQVLTETRTYKLWESAGQKIVEAQLTADQINQLFANIEKGVTAAGGNRTMIGKGKDAASAVNKAWENLKTKVSNSGPIKNVDAMYDQAAEKLKQATGGDQGVMKYVQKYRDFAKKHPIAQSLIYSALIAAAGISGAGAGGAAALGLLKMTDKLLQGQKFSSAAYSGAKTGAMAYAAGQVGKALKGNQQAPSGGAGTAAAHGNANAPFGTDADGIPFDNASDAYTYFKMNPNAPGAKEYFAKQAASFAKDSAQDTGQAATDAAQSAASSAHKSVSDSFTWGGKNYDLTQNDAYQEIMKKYPNGGRGAVSLARKYAQHSIEQGDTSGQISQAATDAAQSAASSAHKSVSDSFTDADMQNVIYNGVPFNQLSAADKEAAIKLTQELEAQGNAAHSTIQAARARAAMQRESRNLSVKEINKLFESVIAQSTLIEGAGWDKFKSGIGQAIGGVATSAKTMGHNLTTKITADKLMSAWKKAGSPTDSNQIADILTKNGVSGDIVTKVFSSMKIPAPSSAAQPAAAKAGASTVPQGGGKVPGQLSQTPGAIRKRQARAAAKTAGAAQPAAGAAQPTATPAANAKAAAQAKAMKRAPGDFAKPTGVKQAGPKPATPAAAPAQPQPSNVPVAGVRTQGGTFAKKKPVS